MTDFLPYTSEMSEKTEIRYCKKCGCELVSTNKNKLCENCRRNRNQTIKNTTLGIGCTVAGVVIFVVTGGKGGIKKQ